MAAFNFPTVLVLLIFLNLFGNCHGSKVDLSAEENNEVEMANDLEDFPVSSQSDSRSTGNCDSPSGCNRYKATVYDLISTSRPSGSIRTVSLVPKRTYFNNEPKEVTETFLVNKAVTETATLEVSQAFRHVDSIDFENNILEKFQASESTALRKLKAGLPTAFQIESSSKQSRRYGVAAKKHYKFQRTVKVSYCEEYEISSIIEMVDNAKTRYRAKLKIIGEDPQGKKLTWQEIHDSLDAAHDGLTFKKGNQGGDEFTAIAATYIHLRETYVGKNITEGKGKPIPECLKALPTIYKADVFSISKTSSNTGTERSVPITYKSVFINDAMEDNRHNASFGNIETADYLEFELSKGLNSMKSISFESGAIASLKDSLLSESELLKDKFIKELPTAFQKVTSSKELRWHRTEEKKRTGLGLSARVPSCMRDERDLSTKIVDSKTDFALKVKITSEVKGIGTKISADEIRKKLANEKGLKFLENAGEFTAVAETSAKLVEHNMNGVYNTHDSKEVSSCIK